MAVTRLPHRIARSAFDRLQDRWRRQPLWEHTVLFESFGGAGFTCNPLALYERMVRDPAFAHYTFVWSVSDTVLARSARPWVPTDARVDFVRHRSRDYFRTLARAKVLVNNVTFPVSFAKRPDQVYVNTWHGTPLKKMGRDVTGGDPAVLADTIANLRSADLVLSQSPYMTDVMYRGAYGLAGGPGILQVGYPRVDVQFDAAQRIATAEQLSAAGIDVAGRRVLLYAPTWRQASDVEAVDDTDRMLQVMRGLAAAAPDAVPLLRVHDKALPFVTGELARWLAPAAVTTNRLLGLADTLITDYSSVFFDFLATGDDVLFFAPDNDDYARGRYLRDNELPGPLTTDLDELLAWVRDGAPEPTGSHIAPALARQRFCPDDDGGATARVLTAIFG